MAYRNGEARVVVVLSQRPKLEMEATFRRIIPAEQRFGTRFVFREGSAIIPDNLRMVAASRAAATIIVSDSSRLATSLTVTLSTPKHACTHKIAGTSRIHVHRPGMQQLAFNMTQQWQDKCKLCACAHGSEGLTHVPEFTKTTET